MNTPRSQRPTTPIRHRRPTRTVLLPIRFLIALAATAVVVALTVVVAPTVGAPWPDVRVDTTVLR